MQKVTAQALCQARKKIRFEAFLDLNQRLLDIFGKEGPVRRWNGFRLWAGDGTTIRLPYPKKLLDYFGGIKTSKDKTRPMARAISVYDILNDLTISATMEPYARAEIDMLMDELIRMKDLSGVLLILDRGFVCFALMRLILDQGGQFLIRAKSKLAVINLLKKSGASQGILNLKLSKNKQSLARCKKYGVSIDSFLVRVIEIPGKGNDGPTYLITSLLDTKEFPYAGFYELYHQRWAIEENYKRKKCRLEIENFTSKTPNGVLMDFHAKVFTENLAAALAHAAMKKVEEDNLKRARASGDDACVYKINFTQLISSFKNTVIHLLTSANPRKFMAQLAELWRSTLSLVRPDRHFERKHEGKHCQPKLQGFYISYKRTV